MNPLCLLVLALSLSVCSSNQYTIVLEMPDTPKPQWRYQVSLVASCDVQPLYAPPNGPQLSIDFDAGTSRPLGDADPGTYGLFAQAIDGGCQVVAAGCVEVELEANGSGEFRVVLESMEAPACTPQQLCMEGRCHGFAPDAGFDAGPTPDASLRNDAGNGSRDAGAADAGRDVGIDVGAPRDAGVDAHDVGVDASDGGLDTGHEMMPDAGSPTFCDRHGVGAYGCLDFESTLAPTWRTSSSGTAAIDIDPTFGYGSGGASLRRAGSAGGASYLAQPVTPVHGEYWFRTQVYLTQEAADDIAYFEIASLSQTQSPHHFLGMSLLRGNRPRLSHIVEGETTRLERPLPNPGDRWVCLEAHVLEDGGMEFYQDGMKVDEADPGALGPWNSINLGGTTAADQVDVEVWIDDIVWSATRVPCDAT